MGIKYSDLVINVDYLISIQISQRRVEKLDGEFLTLPKELIDGIVKYLEKKGTLFVTKEKD